MLRNLVEHPTEKQKGTVNSRKRLFKFVGIDIQSCLLVFSSECLLVSWTLTFFVEGVLLFGCRTSNKDFVFKEEWRTLAENGRLELFTVFSRDQVHNCFIVYSVIES